MLETFFAHLLKSTFIPSRYSTELLAGTISMVCGFQKPVFGKEV
jgi:hypothetical protein